MSDNLNELIRKIKLKKESSQSSDLNKSMDQQQQQQQNDLNESFSPSKPLDENSSTAEFRKYLDDLKKSYLEKLTFSCPSKLLSNSLNLTDMRKSKFAMEKNNYNDNGISLRSSENIHNLLLNNNSNKPTLFSDGTNVRRSLLYDYNKNDSLLAGINNDVKKDNLYTKSNMNISSINKDNQVNLLEDKENINDLIYKNNNNDNGFQLTPDLTKTQMLSRLVQIREYLKQAYTMLATLQTSNDLTNYASQMNKLHSLIDNLKDQEKGYMDLLESFHELTSSLSMNGVSNINSSGQKDVLDISELNESATQTTGSKLNKSLNDSKNNHTTSGYSSLAKRTLNTDDLTSINTNMSSNDSNSISGSFISDTLTLNNCSNVNQSDIVKYNIKKNSKILNKSSFDDEKTDNDQDEDDYENEFDLKEKQNSIREQRQEIFKELDKDMVQLEQLREQKQLLRSIRLRKEELKALEGRRKALEALKQIAVDGENEIDDAFGVLDKKETQSSKYSSTNEMNKLKELEEFNSFLTMLKKETKDENETDSENESGSNRTATLIRKTASIKSNNNNDNYNDESDDNFKIEPSTQIEKSKKQIKHFEEIMSRNSNNNSLIYNPVNDEENNINNNENEQFDEISKKKELNERLASLAENEKKLE